MLFSFRVALSCKILKEGSLSCKTLKRHFNSPFITIINKLIYQKLNIASITRKDVNELPNQTPYFWEKETLFLYFRC